MRLQLLWTMATEFLTLVCGVLLLKIAASVLGPAGFSEYLLTRRAVGLLYLPLVMGLGVAAPRYIAIARTGAMSEFSESAFATATLAAGLFPALAVVLVLNLAPAWGAIAIFGSASLARLVPPASIALAGLAMHGLVYGVYRGRSEMGLANLLQLVNFGVLPLAVFIFGDNAVTVLTALGTGWLIATGVALLHILARESREWRGVASVTEHLRVLLRFGLPRVPGEFALVGIFAVPSLIVVRTHGVVVAGQFSAALSLVTLASGAFTPVSLVLLPHASARAALGDVAGLRGLVVKILLAGVILAGVGVLLAEILVAPFIHWYFGAAYTSAIPIFRACLPGVIPYALYVLMRSILDAVDVKALNSRNLVITFVVVTAVCLVTKSILWTAWGMVGSLTFLGALTLRDTYERLRVSPGHPDPSGPA